MKEKFALILFCTLTFFLFFFFSFQNQPKSEKEKLPSSSSRKFSSFGWLLKKEKPVVLIAAGDVMLGRSVNTKMRFLNDWTYPFSQTASFLRQADLTFINLESPFSENCPSTDTGMIFCSDPKAMAGLAFAGIDIVNLANNHIQNYSQKGIDLTQGLLTQQGITPFGPKDNLATRTIEGTRFGFLGFSLTGNFDQEKIIQRIAQESEKVDVLVVSLHWGGEYRQKSSPWQVNLAHRMVEKGADLILGHHSHVIGEIETYQNVPIVYSLGNFIFDQPWSEETKKGLVGVFTFEGKKLIKTEFKEVYIQNLCQPVIMQ